MLDLRITPLLQGKVLSKVGFAHFCVAEDMFCRAFGNNMAFTDNIGMLADIQCFTHIVVGDQHTNTFVPQVADNTFDVIDRDGVNPGKGLIQQNKLWVCSQCPSNFDAPSLSP